MTVRDVTGAVLASMLIAAATAGSANAVATKPPVDGLSYGRDFSVHGNVEVPIGRRRAVYSLRLPALAAGEILRIRAEVELTKCAPSDTGCGRTSVKPRLSAAVILGTRPDDVTGIPVARAPTTTCTTTLHHCPLDLRRTITVSRGQRGRTYVSLVIDSRGGRPSDKLELKQSLRGGGHLTILRAGRAYLAGRTTVAGATPQASQLPIQTTRANVPPEKVVVYSVPVVGLQRGEVLDVEGSLKVEMDGTLPPGGAPPLLASEVILADAPTQTDSNALAGWRRIARNTGFNCDVSCTATKVGAIRIDGAVKPMMYVNYIGQSSRTTNAANVVCGNTACTAKVRGGGLIVRRLPVGGGVAPSANGACGTVVVPASAAFIGLRITKRSRGGPDPVACRVARRVVQSYVSTGIPPLGWYCAPRDDPGHAVCSIGMRIGWTVEGNV